MDFHDVDRALVEVEALAGTDWLKLCTDRLKEAGAAGPAVGRYGSIPPDRVPPLAYLWYRVKEERALAALNPGAGVSVNMLRLGDLHGDLCLLRQCPGFSDWWPGFREGVDFPLASHQLAVAAGLMRRGWRVELGTRANDRRLNLSFSGMHVRAHCLLTAGWDAVISAVSEKRAAEPPLVLYLEASAMVGGKACGHTAAFVAQLSAAIRTPVAPSAVVFTSSIIRGANRPEVENAAEMWLNPARRLPFPEELLLPARGSIKKERPAAAGNAVGAKK